MSNYDWTTPMRSDGLERVGSEWLPTPGGRRDLRGQIAVDRNTDSVHIVIMSGPHTFAADCVISLEDARLMAKALIGELDTPEAGR